MSVTAANVYFFWNSLVCHDMTRNRLLSTPRPIDAHGIIKKKDDSYWGSVVRDRRTIFLKPNMMLDQNVNYPHMAPDVDLGRLDKDGFVFRQNFHIRSYEVGSQRTITIETLMNLLQETCVNHIKAMGAWGGGLASVTRDMSKKNLTWVMKKLQVVIDSYPIWGDVIQVDIWIGAYKKIGICPNWTFCDGKTGEILLRASCVWLLMNGETRKLSRFPDEVRNELDKHFTNTIPPTDRKLTTRDKSIVDYDRNGLTPIWSDLDINQHVNNAKYIGWILESVPCMILENYELASMTLEYCRECRKEDVLQSHTYVIETDKGKLAEVDCEHVLQLENGGGVIMKGWTTWRPKDGNRLGLKLQNNNVFI